MTGQKEGKKQTEISEHRKKAAGRAKHHTQKASNRGVNAFFANLQQSPIDREFDLRIVVGPVGGGRFKVKDVRGTEIKTPVKIATGLFLPGKLHHRGEMGAAIGPGSYVAVRDDRIEGVLSRRDVLIARQRMGLSSGERVAPEGFEYKAATRRSRSRSRSRSKSRSGSKGKGSGSKTRRKGAGGTPESGNNGKNLDLYKGER
jgi:hypothetical protein